MSTESYPFLGERDDVNERARVLEQVPFFQDLGKDYLLAIARHSRKVQVQPEEVLIRQGDSGEEFALIMTGKVRVEKDGTTVSTLGAGNFFGELAILDGDVRSASIVATEECTLIVLEKAVFEALLRDVPGLERKLLLVLASRLRVRSERPLA